MSPPAPHSSNWYGRLQKVVMETDGNHSLYVYHPV